MHGLDSRLKFKVKIGERVVEVVSNIAYCSKIRAMPEEVQCLEQSTSLRTHQKHVTI
jgi:hypothetical protein